MQTNDTRADESPVNLLHADRLTVTVDQRVLDGSHSFKQWRRIEENGMAQVQLEAGKTHFRHDDMADYVFEGIRWFPNVTESYLDADADLHRVTDREHIAAHVTGGEFTVRDLIDALNHGDLEPKGGVAIE